MIEKSSLTEKLRFSKLFLIGLLATLGFSAANRGAIALRPGGDSYNQYIFGEFHRRQRGGILPGRRS